MRPILSIISIVWLSLIVINPFSTQAASFDCKKTISAVETTICKNETLSKLDDEMANVYIQALSLTSDPRVIKHEQRIWVKIYRNKCQSAECLKYKYMCRIKELKKRINITNYQISDANLIGRWESYSTAFYKTGTIIITPLALFHDACQSKFNFTNNNGTIYNFHSNLNGTCHFISDKESVNYIKVILNNEDITVRYYSGLAEPTLLGEGTYIKVK
jgi:uncharacterized protein